MTRIAAAPFALLLTIGLLACEPEVSGTLVQEIRVPGAWNPPAGVRTAAAAQYVDVVEPPNVRPGDCPGSNPFAICEHPACIRAHPGTSELDRYIRARWDYVLPYGTYVCRRNSNNLSELSTHAVGRAIDAGIRTIDEDADNTAGDAVANWLVANAEYIGIQRVGWDGTWWNGERGFLPMSGSPHRDHLHIELSVDGAARRTRFFTEGPPTETCPVVCYGNAAVAEDCSFVDCAAMGNVCMDAPVRCERAAPPEPPEAVRNPGAAMPAMALAGPLSRFNLLGPVRVFDTRPEGDSSRLVRSDGSMMPLAGTRTGTVTSWPAFPSGATGTWLNLAAVAPAEGGFVTAYPSGPRPLTSSLNFLAGEVRANASPIAFGTGGGVSFFSPSEAHLVVDALGAFAEAGIGFRNTGPRRVLDSRSEEGPIPAMTEYRVNVNAPEGAVGVMANLAVISEAVGFVTAYDCASPRPETSSVNTGASPVVANMVVSSISGGELCIWSTSPAEIIVDVSGYFVPEGELSYQPISPARLLDTRVADSLYTNRLADQQIVEIPIQSLVGAPAGIQSVVVNLTSVDSAGPGYLTAFPCGVDAPLTSNQNYAGGGVVATTAVSTIGGGNLCVLSRSRTHLIVDLLGVWVPTPGAEPPTPPEPPEPPNNEDPPMMELGDAGPGADSGPGGDGGPDFDAGPGGDAGLPGVEGGGCGCSLAAPRQGGLPVLFLLGALWMWRRR
ncbi:MAG: hypothetical protein ACI9KE_002778 [Polyangiales bacterium]|jgi:hypothetical protein